MEAKQLRLFLLSVEMQLSGMLTLEESPEVLEAIEHLGRAKEAIERRIENLATEETACLDDAGGV